MPQPNEPADLERRIRAAWMRVVRAKTPAAKHAAWERMRELVAMRSPGRVKDMERSGG